MTAERDRRHRYGPQWQRQWQERGGAGSGVVAALALALLLLAIAVCGPLQALLPERAAHAAPVAAPSPSATATDTAAATATATATAAPPPAITLLSPTAGQGPAGASITISGTNFTTSQVSIFASIHDTCDTQQGTLGMATANGGSFSAYTFIWPTALPKDQYYICGTGMTSHAPKYWELTASPPTLSLSTTTIQAGQPLTINGTNYFTTLQIHITLQQGSTVSDIQYVSANAGDGTFSVEYTPNGTLNGAAVIVAKSVAENGAPPSIAASASLTLGAASTATAGTTPSPQGTQTGPGTVSRGNPPGSGDGGLVVVLIVAAILALLLIVGLVAFLMLRGRGAGGPAIGYPGAASGPGGFGGYGGTGPIGRYSGGQTGYTTGRMGVPETGTYDTGPKVGAVAQWEDDPRPGPDWQPRPMSGNRRSYDETPVPPYANDYPTTASSYWEDEARQAGWADRSRQEASAPPDPWAEQPIGGDVPSGRGSTNPSHDAEDEWTQVQPRREPGSTGWHAEPGPHTTRPDNRDGDKPEDEQ